MLSPLRYPGGKSDFAPTVAEILDRCGLLGRPLCEPFAGSAAVSLHLLDIQAVPSAHLCEKDPLVFSFWHSIKFRFDEFVEKFIDLPITLDTWKSLRPLLTTETPDSTNVVDLGVACLFFNRANFSGIINAGPIGGMTQSSVYSINCRTNKDEIIARLLSIAMISDRLSVTFGDAVSIIKNGASEPHRVLYIDPPYFEKGELLYRKHYKLGDHKQLAKALSNCSEPWLLSYDDHHIIEFLYSEQKIKRIKFRYSAHSPKNHDELLISNFEIPFDPEVTRQARS